MIIHLFNSSSVSGPERLVLPALARIRDHVTIINLREERIGRLRESDPLEEYARSLNLDYLDVRVCGHWDYVAARDLRMLLERLDPDLVHAHDVKASAYLLQARQGWAKDRFRIVSTHHGVHGRPDWKTRLYEWIYRRFLLKSFDRTFCVSSADYEFLRRSGIKGNQLQLHLNGIDGRFVETVQRSKEAQVLRTQWLPQEVEREKLFLFGVVGRLSPEKDHDRLLEVLSELNRLPCEQEWRCLIFGNGPLEEKLQQDVKRLGLEERVRWMGYRNDVGSELAGLDLVLSFSKAEGLPINLIEAGWAGTPVMSTQVGGVTDLIPDERFGIRIPPEETVGKTALRLRACLTSEGRETLRQQALRFQQRAMAEFTQAKWLQRLKELYAELGVNVAVPAMRSSASRSQERENRSFGQKLQSSVLNRLLMYPTGRLEEVRDWNRNGFRILMYHHFSASNAPLQEALAKQCAHINRYYHVLSLTEIAQSLRHGTPLPPNTVAVTVDDGYRDFMTMAYPVFCAYQIPVTMYLVTAFMDGKSWLWWDQIHYAVEHTQRSSLEIHLLPGLPPVVFSLRTGALRHHTFVTLTEMMKKVSNVERLRFLKEIPRLLGVEIPVAPPWSSAPMDWSDVRYLADHGVEFGAHTHSHPILSRLSSAEELTEEIVYSKRRIESELGRPVVHFGYPNGRREDVNESTFRVLKDNAFQTAVTAEKGVNFQGVHPFWLRRIGIDPLMSKFNFQALLAGLGGGRSKEVPLSLACH